MIMKVRANQTVEALYLSLLKKHFKQLERSESAARSGGDIEGVHRMRVSLRKMRTILALFELYIGHKAVSSLAKEMRWAAKELDQARDLDVYIATYFGDEVLIENQIALLAIAQKRRNKGYKKVNRLIGSKRYSKLKRQLQKSLDEKPWRNLLPESRRKALQGEPLPVAAKIIKHHLDRVKKKGKTISDLNDSDLHKLRIRCKELRYALLFFSPLFGGSIALLLCQLEKLQNILGEIHDCIVVHELHDWMLSGESSLAAVQAAEQIERRCGKRKRQLEKQLLKCWRAFASVSFDGVASEHTARGLHV